RSNWRSIPQDEKGNGETERNHHNPSGFTCCLHSRLHWMLAPHLSVGKVHHFSPAVNTGESGRADHFTVYCRASYGDLRFVKIRPCCIGSMSSTRSSSKPSGSISDRISSKDILCSSDTGMRGFSLAYSKTTSRPSGLRHFRTPASIASGSENS